MKRIDPSVENLVPHFYEGILDPGLWAEALQGLRALPRSLGERRFLALVHLAVEFGGDGEPGQGGCLILRCGIAAFVDVAQGEHRSDHALA